MKEKRINKKFVWIAFIISFILLLFAFRFLFKELPDRSHLVSIKGVLKDDIIIKTGRHGNRVLLLNLKEYPDIDFCITRIPLRKTYFEKLINENHKNDSVSFFIERKGYRRKILKIEGIPFPGNYLFLNRIGIVEINRGNFEYLSLEKYNQAHKKNNHLAFGFFGFFGMLMFYLGIKGIQYIKKNFK